MPPPHQFKQHLDLLPIVAADLVRLRLAAGPCEVSSVFMLFPTDRSTDRIGAAHLFGGTSLAIGLEGPILSSAADILAAVGIRVDSTELFEREAFRAFVLIVGLVIFKLKPRPGAVFAVRVIDHRNEWDDPALLDQPTQVIAGTVSRVCGEPSLGRPLLSSAEMTAWLGN